LKVFNTSGNFCSNVVKCKVCFYINCLAGFNLFSTCHKPVTFHRSPVQPPFSHSLLNCAHPINNEDRHMATNRNRKANPIRTAALAIALGTGLWGSSAIADTQVRLQSSNDAGSFSEGYALSVEDWSALTFTARTTGTNGFHYQSSSRPQIWISDIGTLLFDDFDGDGYHSGFSLTIDVDSEFGDTEVYAKIYLEPADDAAIFLHKTGQFTVYGTTIGDEYRVDSELRNNYPTNDYNVAIDIHDAWTDKLLDSATARGFDNLNRLPLESANLNDSYSDYDDHVDSDIGSADLVVTEHAGLFHPLLLLLVAGVAWMRRR